MVFGILLIALTCCSPVAVVCGGVSIFHANKVARLWQTGDRDGSRAAAKAARMWALGGVVGSIVFGCLVGIVVAAASGGAS